MKTYVMNVYFRNTLLLVVPLVILIAAVIVVRIADKSSFPDGIEIASTDPYSKILVSRDFYYNFSGSRSDLVSNILIASYVEWAEGQGNYIFGFNRSSPNSKLDKLSPNGYFLIDYPRGEIYYLDKITLDNILNGSSPNDIGITPQVRFTKVKQ